MTSLWSARRERATRTFSMSSPHAIRATALPVNAAEMRQRFFDLFGESGKLRVFRAPGRVNLIGEHTDYNDGFVFPAALGFSTKIAVRARNDRTIRVHSSNFGETYTFTL